MSVHIEAIAKVLFLVGAIAFVYRYTRFSGSEKLRRLWQWGAIVLSLLCWLNFGKFHTDGSFLHNWDQFHYFVGAKYFPELRYDGLYAASLAALSEADGTFKPPQRVRDLRKSRTVDYPQIAQQQQEVRQRFSDERWELLKADLVRIPVHPDAFRDHGYNATPQLSFVLHAMTNWLPIRKRSMVALAVFDLLLIALVFVLIRRSYGLEKAAFVALLFGGAFCSRFYWTGGALMRFDWVLATVAAICACRKERFLFGGLALGYAISVRIFPLLFLIPLAGYFFANWREGKQRALRFGLGLIVSGVALGAAGCLTGHGVSVYGKAYEKLSAHREAPMPNNIGARMLIVTSLDNLKGELTHPETLYEFDQIDDDFRQVQRERWAVLAVVMLAGFAFSFFMGRGAESADHAITLGLVPLALMQDISCYYWIIFALLPIVASHRGAMIGLVANLAMFMWAMIALAAPSMGWVTRFNGMLVFAPCSLIVIAALLIWCWPVAFRPRPSS